MSILLCIMNVRNREWTKQQMNWQVSFPIWILDVKNYLLKNTCNWQERKLLMLSITWPSWWIWHRLEYPFGFKFEWRASGGEWCEWPANIKSQTSSSPSICPWPTKSKHPLEFSVVDVVNMQYFMNKLNNMSYSNMINKHHRKTIGSYFRSVWYDEDIIMGTFLGVWHCKHISLIKMLISYLCIFIVYTNDSLHWNKSFSSKTSIVQHLRPKSHIMQNMTFEYTTFSCATKRILLKGGGEQ